MTIDLTQNLDSLVEKIEPLGPPKNMVFRFRGINDEIINYMSRVFEEQDILVYIGWLKMDDESRHLNPIRDWWSHIGRTVQEAIRNSIVHGQGILKKAKPRQVISLNVQIFYGRAGLVYSIQDLGNGFAVDEVVRKMQSNESYFQVDPIQKTGGMGFHLFSSSLYRTNPIVSFNYKGNAPPIGTNRIGNENYGNNILLCYLFHPTLIKKIQEATI